MCFLYLMHARTNEGDAFKIGISKNPYTRRQVFGRAVTLLCYWRFDSAIEARDTEKCWHDTFESRRVPFKIGRCGEWFELTAEEVKTFVAACTVFEAIDRCGESGDATGVEAGGIEINGTFWDYAELRNRFLEWVRDTTQPHRSEEATEQAKQGGLNQAA